MRLVLQGDLNDHVSLYFQPDFAAAVSNQSVGERREGTVSLRDMYADVFPTGDKSFRIRLGQSKTPLALKYNTARTTKNKKKVSSIKASQPTENL